MAEIWGVLSAWGHRLKKLRVRVEVLPSGKATITIVPSAANLLLYAVHQERGWSRCWPGRDLAPHSPYDLYGLLFCGYSDLHSSFSLLPFELILVIIQKYLGAVYEVLFSRPYAYYNISFEAIQAIAQMMRPRSQAKKFSGTVKEVLGTAKTMGFAVDLTDPVIIQKKIDTGALVCQEDGKFFL
jgi:ribosomal protein L11